MTPDVGGRRQSEFNSEGGAGLSIDGRNRRRGDDVRNPDAQVYARRHAREHVAGDFLATPVRTSRPRDWSQAGRQRDVGF